MKSTSPTFGQAKILLGRLLERSISQLISDLCSVALTKLILFRISAGPVYIEGTFLNNRTVPQSFIATITHRTNLSVPWILHKLN
jgi:hypothetical protein